MLASGLAGVAVAQEEEPGVAVLDTGTNDLNINVVGGFNFFNGSEDLSDRTDNSHGTTVSRIVNEEAPGIPQYQLVVTDGAFTPSPSATEAAVLNAANNANVRIIAYSSGVASVPSPALTTASDAGKFIAIRAGNDAGPNPSISSVSASGLPGVAVVVATDGAGGVLPSSNACGTTAERCVGTLGITQFSDLAGTSFAAARLAGIAAQVLRDAPFLDAEELAQVIFDTAEDTGDPRLGNGFVRNAEQVINSPAGPSSVGDGGGFGLGVAALAVGAAAGAALLVNNEEELEKTLVLDSFGRPFHVDLTELAKIKDERRSIAGFFNSLEQRHDRTRLQLGEHHTLDAAYVTSDLEAVDPGKYFAFEHDPAFGDRELDWVLSLSGEYANGFHYQVDKNRDPSLNFGVMDNVYEDSLGGRSRFLSGQSFAVPLLGFASVADSVSLGLGSGDGFGLDFGLVNTDDEREHGRESVSAVLEGSYRFRDRAELSVQVGRLKEDGSLFGGASNGSFSVDATNTVAASLSASLRVADDTHLVGNYGVAQSDINEARFGLLKNFSSVRSDWFGLGLVTDEVIRDGDQWGLAFSQPLRVSDGEVDMVVPHARDFEGNIYKRTERVSLEPHGREYTLESYYLRPLGRRSSVGAYVMLRRDPNHFADSGTGLTVLASYRTRF